MIKEYLKESEGDVLAIGLSDEEEKFLRKNTKINDVATLHNKRNITEKVKVKVKQKEKNVSIRKLRKKFKKNRVDYTFCNINDVEEYLKYIIKDTIYFTKYKIYLYWNNDEDLEEKLKKRYNRYNVKTSLKRKNERTFLIIEIHDKKKNRIKDFFYFIGDTFSNLIEILRNFLIY